MDMMQLNEVAQLRPINEVDVDKALEIANAIKGGEYNGPALLYHEPNNAAITGSHRIEAANILVNLDADHDFELGYSEIEIPVIDVTEYIEKYCDNNDCSFEEIPFDTLRDVFEGTNIEKEVKKNEEW